MTDKFYDTQTVYVDGKDVLRDSKKGGVLMSTEYLPHDGVLYLIGAYPQNRGCYFKFRDGKGYTYFMSQSAIAEWLERNPVCLGIHEWKYLKRGTVYSIGVIK